MRDGKQYLSGQGGGMEVGHGQQIIGTPQAGRPETPQVGRLARKPQVTGWLGRLENPGNW